MRMGQNSSVPTGVRRERRKSFRGSWRSPFPRRSQTHQGSLSATFNFIDVDLKVINMSLLVGYLCNIKGVVLNCQKTVQ
jgi:hypothetical protein